MFYVVKLILYTDALRAFGEHGFNGCPAGVLFKQKKSVLPEARKAIRAIRVPRPIISQRAD